MARHRKPAEPAYRETDPGGPVPTGDGQRHWIAVLSQINAVRVAPHKMEDEEPPDRVASAYFQEDMIGQRTRVDERAYTIGRMTRRG
jgi:hypothetical protein